MMTRHGCAFCVALQRFAIRRRDVELIDAAERLSADHVRHEEQAKNFARANAQHPARGAQAEATATTHGGVTLSVGDGSSPAIQRRFHRKA